MQSTVRRTRGLDHAVRVAGAPSSGRSACRVAPRESCPRVEAQRLAREVPSPSPPVSRLLRLHLLRAASGLALPVSPRGFAGTPPWLYAPPRLPWRRLVHSFPFPPPSPGVPRPPRWESARSGRGRAPMNSGVPATLAVRRVKFFGRHGGEVRPSGLCPDSRLCVQSGSWFCVVGVPECSLGISLGYGV